MDNLALDAELTKLMDQIPSFYKAFRADNTVRQHSYAFNSFCKWCFSHNIVNILPFSDVYVAMYLMHLAILIVKRPIDLRAHSFIDITRSDLQGSATPASLCVHHIS
jgi:hypothetical protein